MLKNSGRKRAGSTTKFRPHYLRRSKQNCAPCPPTSWDQEAELSFSRSFSLVMKHTR